MKFFFIVLNICCYIISQTTIDARTTGLRNNYWSLPSNGDYQGALNYYKSDRRRQAGWGKRHDDEYDELPSYHPFASQDDFVRTWFDDK